MPLVATDLNSKKNSKATPWRKLQKRRIKVVQMDVFLRSRPVTLSILELRHQFAFVRLCIFDSRSPKNDGAGLNSVEIAERVEQISTGSRDLNSGDSVSRIPGYVM